MADIRLHIAYDRRGTTVSFGPRQAAWLVEHGHAELDGYEQTSPDTGLNRYRLLRGLSAEAADALVVKQPELRECDFCDQPATHEVRHRGVINLTLPDAAGGPVKRSIFTCDRCTLLVEANAKAELVGVAITSRVERAIREGGEAGQRVALLSPAQVNERLGASVRAFVLDVFAKREGRPERFGGSGG
jgi:hypothetical protein